MEEADIMKGIIKQLSPALVLGLGLAAAGEARAASDYWSDRQFQSQVGEAGRAIAGGEGASGVSWLNVAPKPTQDSSWEEIERSRLVPDYPKVSFGTLVYGTVFMSVDGLCVDGGTLRSKGPVEQCVELRSGHDRSDCAKSVSAVVSRPVRYKKEECVKRARSSHEDVCLKTEVVDAVVPTSFDVDVRDYWGGGKKGDARVLFTKRYDIPACR